MTVFMHFLFYFFFKLTEQQSFVLLRTEQHIIIGHPDGNECFLLFYPAPEFRDKRVCQDTLSRGSFQRVHLKDLFKQIKQTFVVGLENTPKTLLLFDLNRASQFYGCLVLKELQFSLGRYSSHFKYF
jgi:hypothetical protein